MTRLPCMAIKQPHASLVVRGVKDVENRSRALPEQLRGKWCAIYASLTLAPVASWIDAQWNVRAYHRLAEHWPWHGDIKASRKECARGAIVGLVRWEASTRTNRSKWAEPDAHHWTYSDRVVLAEPVPLPDGGCQSIYWYLSAQVADQVCAAAGNTDASRIMASLLTDEERREIGAVLSAT